MDRTLFIAGLIGCFSLLYATAGQAGGTAFLVGAMAGAAIGLHWMSERTTRYALAAILLFAGTRLLIR
jgi:hypothetical protein